MKKFRKLLISAVIALSLISCATLSSEDYFKRGNYIASLELIPKEISSAKTAEEIAGLKNRAINIVSIYENNYLHSDSAYVKAQTSYDLFKIVNLVEDNLELQKYTTVHLKYNTNSLLKEAISNTKIYANSINSLDPLTTLLGRMQSDSLIASRNLETYRLFSQYVADKYIDQAINYERSGYVERARDSYKVAFEAYREFDRNYRNTYSKYMELNRKVDVLKAEEAISKASKYNILGNYDEALREYKKAVEIFEKYSMYTEYRIYKAAIEKIELEKDLKLADEYFNRGFNYYNNQNYAEAKSYFSKAQSIYTKYNKSDKLSQIKVYLENIEFKLNKQSGDKYFEQALSYYRANDLYRAKEYFIKAKEIYRTFNNIEKVNEASVYLELIETKIKNPNSDNPTDNNYMFNENYNKAKEYQRFAEYEKNLEKKKYYNKEAIKYYSEALKYTTDYSLRNKIKKQINILSSYIKDDESYDFYYKKGVEHYNEYFRYYNSKDREKAIYFLREALKIAERNNNRDVYQIRRMLNTIEF